MLSSLKENLNITKGFFLVRFLVVLVIGVLYVILATGIQYAFVSLLGKTSFNYILGAFIALFLTMLLIIPLSKVLFLGVRGWQVACLGYASIISERNLPPLEASWKVFKKHFSSFATFFVIATVLGKFIRQGLEKIWELFEDVPVLHVIAEIKDNALAQVIGSDILGTAYDAVIMYIVRYTKAGISDDMQALPGALKNYLLALPVTLCASIAQYLLLRVLPVVLQILLSIYLLFANGLLRGLVLALFLFPMCFAIRLVFLDSIYLIIILTGFIRRCERDIAGEEEEEETEEEDEEEEGVVAYISELLESLDIIPADAPTKGKQAKKKSTKQDRKGTESKQSTKQPSKQRIPLTEVVEEDVDEQEFMEAVMSQTTGSRGSLAENFVASGNDDDDGESREEEEEKDVRFSGEENFASFDEQSSKIVQPTRPVSKADALRDMAALFQNNNLSALLEEDGDSGLGGEDIDIL